MRRLHVVVSLGLRSRPQFDTFIPLLLVTVAVAALIPARGVAADVLSVATKVAVALLFALYGARLSPLQAWQSVRHWRLLLMVLSVTFVVFPLLGLATWFLVPTVLTPELYNGVLFLCLVPSTVQSSIAFTSIARGNVSAAIVTASLSNLIGVVLTPLLVMALISSVSGLHVDGSSVLDIVVQLFVPFVAGQLLRPWVAGWVSRHTVVTKIVERGSILLVVYAAFSVGMTQDIWSRVTPWQVVAVAVVSAALLAVVLGLTAGLGRMFRLDRGDAVVLLFCGSKKSMASGLPMALVLFGTAAASLIMLPLMIFHQIQLVVCAVFASRMSRAAPLEV